MFGRMRLAAIVAVCSGLALLLPGRAAAQVYADPVITPTAADVQTLAVADLNHDGVSDLIGLDSPGYGEAASLQILLGNGHDGFIASQDIVLPAGTWTGVYAADFTGDGLPDVIVTGNVLTSEQAIPTILAFPANGDGTLQAAVTTSVGTGIGGTPALAVADLNGDGKPDLIVGGQPDSTAPTVLLPGDGTGHFGPAQTLSSAQGTPYLLDLNGDGHLDVLLLAPIRASFAVLLGNGDGTFQPAVTYPVNIGGLYVADVNGDGHPDVVSVGYQYAAPHQVLAYYPGLGDGTFGALMPITAVPNQLMELADLNGDGLADFLYFTADGLGTQLNEGNQLGALQETLSGSSPNQVPAVVGNFDTSGHAGVAMAVEGGIAILPGHGDGTFASGDVYDLTATTGATAIGDFNGDGVPDIAVSVPGTYPQVLLGNGGGTFSPAAAQNSGASTAKAPGSLIAADFNGDGRLDIDTSLYPLFSRFGTNTQTIELGTGTGTFDPPLPSLAGQPYTADVNGDGKTDLITMSASGIQVTLGGTWTTVVTPTSEGALSFQAGDFNGDGKLDLVLAYADHFETWFGHGDGTFSFGSRQSSAALGAYYGFAAAADLDGDGHLDLVETRLLSANGNAPSFAVLYGNGDGTFQAPVFTATSHWLTQATVADMNHDGRPDLVLTDGLGVGVFLNAGGRQFLPEQDLTLGATVGGLSVADLNGNGFPDLVAAQPAGPTTAYPGGTSVGVVLSRAAPAVPVAATAPGVLNIAPAAGTAGLATLTLSPADPAAPTPTGFVSFYVDGGLLGSAPLNDSAAEWPLSGVSAELHDLYAIYSGDGHYALERFETMVQPPAPQYATQTTLAVTPATLFTGQTLRLSATVTSAQTVPAGLVTFYDGSQVLGASPLKQQQAGFDTALLGSGPHALSARYQGYTAHDYDDRSQQAYVSAVYLPSSAPPINFAVNAVATVTSLSSLTGTPTAGGVVTLQAQVAAAAEVPFGGVSFYDGATLLGTMGLDGGDVSSGAQARLSLATLAAGRHQLTAVFNANGPFASSTSSVLDLTIGATPSSVAAAQVSLNLSPQPDAGMTLNAQLSSAAGTPAGLVTFLDNGQILAVAPTGAGGDARVVLPAWGPGAHSLTASFAGGNGYAAAVSPPLAELWPNAQPGFELQPPAGVIEVAGSSSSAIPIAVAGAGSFAAPVQLACISGLPAGYTCQFSPAGLSEPGTVMLTLHRSQTSAALPAASPTSAPRQGFLAVIAVVLGTVLLGAWMAGEPRRRWVGILTLTAAAVALGACASPAASAAPPVVHILTVRAVSGSGPNQAEYSAQCRVRFE